MRLSIFLLFFTTVLFCIPETSGKISQPQTVISYPKPCPYVLAAYLKTSMEDEQFAENRADRRKLQKRK